MNNNRKWWWKTWNSILHDAKFQNINLEDIGFWTLLMSLVCEQGERGKLTIIPPASITMALLRCSGIEDFKTHLKRLPNVHIEEGPQTVQEHGENGQFQRSEPSKSTALNDYGEITVTIHKWYTYQVDSTAKDRGKTLRHKRREEKRREENGNFFEHQKPLAGPYGG